MGSTLGAKAAVFIVAYDMLTQPRIAIGVRLLRRHARVPQARSTALSVRGLALHLTLVPTVLTAATLAGIDLPGAAWLPAFGPLPLSVVSFAQLYGYSPRTAATGLVLSLAAAIALLPLAY